MKAAREQAESEPGGQAEKHCWKVWNNAEHNLIMDESESVASMWDRIADELQVRVIGPGVAWEAREWNNTDFRHVIMTLLLFCF